ncbi:extracellular solute-binding protein [Pararhodobacter sp.]|jgi:spermidine/putrescine transport system substrate-binding protein|uniref:extracellular solute-binding protein n=1 Tax=Pararhodobacter sp. TaxID=2127056 RepID=UPI002FDDF4BB
MTLKDWLLTAGLAVLAGPALADGELHIYTWGNYTNPTLIDRFEEAHGVRVTITDYDSSDTAIARIRQGGHGFDIVVPAAVVTPVWIEEGLLLETNPAEMENFIHVDERFRSPSFDPERRYTVPWLWGSTGVTVNTSAYDGDINTSAIFLDPPSELRGRVNVVPELADILFLAIRYVGGDWCTDDRDVLRATHQALLAAKEHWISIDYGSLDSMVGEDLLATVTWNGAALRMRAANPDLHYGYPREGYPLWMDSVAVLADASNVDNARLFMNFVMDPENAALITAFAGYANSITGSEAYLPEELLNAPEIIIPDDLVEAGELMLICDPAVMDLYARMWMEVMQ